MYTAARHCSLLHNNVSNENYPHKTSCCQAHYSEESCVTLVPAVCQWHVDLPWHSLSHSVPNHYTRSVLYFITS